MGNSISFLSALPPAASSGPYPLAAWWMHQWLANTAPLIKFQVAYLETLSDAMQHEAEFIKVLAESGDKLARCAQQPDVHQGPSGLAACYQDVAGSMADATLRRFTKVSELSHDFRERIWDEL